MSNSFSLISPSLSDIENKFKEIQKSKLGLTDNFLNTGAFAYLNQSNAVMLRDSIYHRMSLYNESFLNTAIIPKSIYNWAKLFNVNVTRATPAYTTIQFKIDQTALLQALSVEPSVTEEYNMSRYGEHFIGEYIILDRNYPIIVGENIHFHLERSIIIRKLNSTSSIDTKYITASYLKHEPTTTTYDSNTDYLKVGIKDGEFIIHANVYQYQIQKITKQITDGMSNLLSRVHNFEFTQQFVAARLYYIKNNVRREIPLYYSVRPTGITQYAIYNIVDENEIQIKFDNRQDAFAPEPNSSIELQVFTTRGSNVDRLVTGNGSYSVDISNINQVLFLNNLTVVFNDYIKGGINIPPLSDVKQTIINEISTRKILITENDLNLFFGQLSTTLKHIANSEVRFVKRRDDVLKRVFDTYLLLRNQDENNVLGDCIPTNTISADFPVSANTSKPAGSILRKKNNNEDGVELGYEYATEIIDSTMDYYVIPFYTRILLDPINVVKYIYNVCDDSSTLEYKNVIRNQNMHVTPLDISVKRGMSGGYADDTYIISFRLQSDVRLENIPFKLNILNTRSTLLETIRFEEKYIDTKTINTGGESTLYETEMSVGLKVASEEFEFNEKDTSNNYGTYIKILTPQNQTISLPEDVLFEIVFNDRLLQNRVINSTFKSTTKVSLFKNLDDILFSDIRLRKKTYYEYVDDEGKTIISPTKPEPEQGDSTEISVVKRSVVNSVYIENIPVIHSTFFSNETYVNNQATFIRQMFAYIDMLRGNIHRLENSTFFNIKFFNTFGRSYRTSSIKTNIDLKMVIKLVSSAHMTDSNRSVIKYAIRKYIDDSNNDGRFNISNLITYLETTFNNIISSIEIISLNDSGTESIQHIDAYPNEAMEWINIQPDDLDNGVQFTANR